MFTVNEMICVFDIGPDDFPSSVASYDEADQLSTYATLLIKFLCYWLPVPCLHFLFPDSCAP